MRARPHRNKANNEASAKINRDTRHHAVKIMKEPQIKKRLCDGWIYIYICCVECGGVGLFLVLYKTRTHPPFEREKSAGTHRIYSACKYSRYTSDKSPAANWTWARILANDLQAHVVKGQMSNWLVRRMQNKQPALRKLKNTKSKRHAVVFLVITRCLG